MRVNTLIFFTYCNCLNELSTRCEITWFNFDTVLKRFHALLHDFVWIKKCIPQVISFQLLSAHREITKIHFYTVLCHFHEHSHLGRVLELLINFKKASTSPTFEENVERFLCLRFSITHTHDPHLFRSKIILCYLSYFVMSLKCKHLLSQLILHFSWR